MRDIKKLEAREHILRYPDAFLGSTSKLDVPRLGFHPEHGLKYITGYTPAAIRCLKEVLDNSLDAAIRVDFRNGCNIHISLDENGFAIEDDGHGIPIKFNEKENMWAPQLALSEERAGSNFDVDERSTVGMYGVGVFCTNVVSKSLELVTCDGERVYSQLFGNNCSHKTEPTITKNDKLNSGTYVRVELDQKIINWTDADKYCCLQLMNNIMFVYPELDITADIDGIEVDLLKGDKYYEALNIKPWTELSSSHMRVVLGSYENKLYLRGLVNGTECNGVHLSTFKTLVSAELIKIWEKDIEGLTRADISKTLSGLLSFRIINPAFGGLTKNDLTGCDQAKLKEDIEDILPDIIRDLSNSEYKQLVEEVVAKRLDKKIKTRERKAAKARRSLKLVDVYKSGRKKNDTYLLITEGDSAKGLFLQARRPDTHALYPLRGKILNAVAADDVDTVSRNKVLFELATILGLSLTNDNIDRLRYTYVVMLTDADLDGSCISGLLISFFYKFWPDLFKEGKILRLLTPSHIDVTKKKRIHHYHAPKRIYGHLEYIKGLASLTLDDVKRILEDPKFEIMVPDIGYNETIELVMGKSAERKRQWLSQ